MRLAPHCNGGGSAIRTREPITGTDLQSACFGRLHIPPLVRLDPEAAIGKTHSCRPLGNKAKRFFEKNATGGSR